MLRMKVFSGLRRLRRMLKRKASARETDQEGRRVAIPLYVPQAYPEGFFRSEQPQNRIDADGSGDEEDAR